MKLTCVDWGKPIRALEGMIDKRLTVQMGTQLNSATKRPWYLSKQDILQNADVFCAGDTSDSDLLLTALLRSFKGTGEVERP